MPSSNFHTPFVTNYALTKANWNAPASQLDSAITNFLAGSQAASLLKLTGGSVAAGSLTGTNVTDKGHNLPRMTTTQRDAINSPATGLMVFNITTSQVNVYNGTSWVDLALAAGTGALRLLASGDESNVASVAIASIPQDYLDLILILNARSRKASGNSDVLGMRFNGDSTPAAYDTHGLWWNSTTTNTLSDPGNSRVTVSAFLPSATQESQWRGHLLITIPNYARGGTSVSGWGYTCHRVETANLFYREALTFVYQAADVAVQSITLQSQTASPPNIDVRYRLYGRGVL